MGVGATAAQPGSQHGRCAIKSRSAGYLYVRYLAKDSYEPMHYCYIFGIFIERM